MKLKFIKAQEIDRNVKATIHTSGKLGFTSEAAKKMKLDENRSAAFAIDEENPDEGNLFVQVNKEVVEDSFRVSKAGDYYYINTRALFDTLGVDYRSVRVMYDIVEVEYEGNRIFKMLKREGKKREK
jgi:hypothetical protein